MATRQASEASAATGESRGTGAWLDPIQVIRGGLWPPPRVGQV